jgi:hypothetical protein
VTLCVQCGEAISDERRADTLYCSPRCRSQKHYNQHPEKAKARRDALANNEPSRKMLYAARHRAKKIGVPCNISPDDIIIPEICRYSD